MKKRSFCIKTVLSMPVVLSLFCAVGCGGKLETRTQTVDEDFSNIEVVTETADVTFVSSVDGKCMVVSNEKKRVTHTATVSDGVLKIQVSDARGWFEKLFGSKMSVTVYLPENEYGSLSVECDTGDVKIEKALKLGEVSISADTGDVELDGIACKNITAEVDTGDVSIDDVSALGKIYVKTDTGNIEIEGASATRLSVVTDTGKTEIESCKADDIAVSSDTGKISLDGVDCTLLGIDAKTANISLERVIAEGKFDITSSTGNVTFDSCDAASVFVKTSTGDVTGNFLTDKVIFADTSTGKIDIPKLTSGGKCEITTSTGDIKITVSK